MIAETDLEKIQAKNELDLQDYVIITIPENIEDISANLLGPVVNQQTAQYRGPIDFTKQRVLN